MNINHKITGTVISACLSLSLLASCNTAPTTAPIPMANTTASQMTGSANSTQMSPLAAQAQLALANYHDVDASFYDTVQISGQGGFQTKLLGLNIVDDVVDIIDNNDNDTDEDNNSTESQLGLGVNVNADVNANAQNDTHSNTNSNANLGIGADIGANVDTNVDTNGNSSSGTSSNSGIDINTNVGANVNTATSNDLINEMNNNNARLSTDITANGAVNLDTNGNRMINGEQLRTNVDTMIGGSSEARILENLNIDTQVNAMTSLSNDTLIRLEDRGFTATGGELQSQQNTDGTLTNVFGLNLTGNDTNRNIISANRLQNDTSLGVDLMLRENGSGFTREANRMSRITAQGNLSIVTRANTHLSNGGSIEIFEERFTDATGNGAGNGFITLTGADGNQESFDFNTLVKADGSLVSNLDLGDTDTSGTSALILREDASGNASLSLLGNDQQEQRRLNLDFNAMLDAMGDVNLS
jgi:hypothetical protein